MSELNIGVQCVTISRASELTGYSEAAIRTKCQSNEWAEGVVWKYGPDGRVLVMLQGYNRWCMQEGKPSTRGRKSRSGGES